MPATQTRKPTQEERNDWLKKQREIHGEKVIPDYLVEPDKPAEDDTQGVAQAFYDLLGTANCYEIGGKRFSVEEPTLGQIKKRLMPIFKSMDLTKGTDEILSEFQGLDEFQRLLLDCLVFEDGQEVPTDLLAWSDDLKFTPAMELAEAFTESLDWAGMIERAAAIQGKIRGVRGKAAN